MHTDQPRDDEQDTTPVHPESAHSAGAPPVESEHLSPHRWLLTVDDDGMITLPDELWQRGVLAEHARFDLVVRPDDSLVLRGCPLDLEGFRRHGPGHPDDPEWTDASVCGLTKWTCAGCGSSTVVEHCDCFPAGWLDVSARKADGDTIASAAVCSRACLGTFAGSDRPLLATPIPGFSPAEA